MAWAETVYGKPCASISDRDGADPLKSVSGKRAWAPLDAHEPLPEIPEMFKAEPAVLEAGRIIRGCSSSHFITDGRVVR
ncbi:hypothetical protein LCGC14_2215440 [marine sediment metagenome]|uniref:Uncharacterized protein n=1 Tax=marine sediment metagenome TaxID=412755 RepID=A0A0F9DCH3_9ZZZZ